MSEVHEHGKCNFCRRQGCEQIAALEERIDTLENVLRRYTDPCESMGVKAKEIAEHALRKEN